LICLSKNKKEFDDFSTVLTIFDSLSEQSPCQGAQKVAGISDNQLEPFRKFVLLFAFQDRKDREEVSTASRLDTNCPLAADVIDRWVESIQMPTMS